ncbi:crustacyanin-A2 subunit [Cherax quadricarinatus]|uniref:crustacyanin-A2 subunit n=1 Tax=Cherax quadricarinatus TaxID=27406 RepID=UPI0023789C77|nr:crustacyanin-A2 subunit-like [Cherax quadricarinatus]
MFRTVIITALLAGVSAQRIPSFLKPGKCASVANQDNFDLEKYAGRWYQTQVIENPFQPLSRCILSTYDYSKSDYGFKVTTAGFSPDDEYLKIDLKIYPTKEFPAAHMLIDAPSLIASPYEVIETDYDTYSCVYSCISTGNFKAEFGFVFSRTPQTSGPAAEKCAAVFNKNGVEFSKFVPVSQTAECPYKI